MVCEACGRVGVTTQTCPSKLTPRCGRCTICHRRNRHTSANCPRAIPCDACGMKNGHGMDCPNLPSAIGPFSTWYQQPTHAAPIPASRVQELPVPAIPIIQVRNPSSWSKNPATPVTKAPAPSAAQRTPLEQKPLTTKAVCPNDKSSTQRIKVS